MKLEKFKDLAKELEHSNHSFVSKIESLTAVTKEKDVCIKSLRKDVD